MLPRTHSFVGTTIVLLVPNSFVSLPLAFASHLVLDKFRCRADANKLFDTEFIIHMALLTVSLSIHNPVIILGFVFASGPDLLDAIFRKRKSHFMFKKRKSHFMFKKRILLSKKIENTINTVLFGTILLLARSLN